ncbi:hypothetical protein IDM40_09240 [Nocardiopsis sp. HNM0947]|uniref:Uncharacterized protein n=1 Tax=Nocardiopsis coralli TaxID=2772213 RepID=A0ABR9P4X7_9ACTN|nr:hypothetical protein [Nocardiopsis coralli]MBE2998888.1 hypothetical protein [Nocardiopsis coralli]
MSHWRLNNPRSSRAKSALASRVKHKPRHAFCAERAITALLGQLAPTAARQLDWSGSSEMTVMTVRNDINVWCRDGQFFWNDLGQTFCHPASDPAGAAALLDPFAGIPEPQPSPYRIPHTVAAPRRTMVPA